MPLLLNVGVTKKQGLPDYGSLGASCNLTVEMDAALLQDLDSFHRQVKSAYVSCTQAVNEELARQQGAGSTISSVANGSNGHSHNGNGHANGHTRNGQSGSSSNGQASHRASQKQSDYIYQLSKQIKGLGVRRLEGLAEKMFGKPLTELTSMDASGLIDTMKEIKEGRISLDDALNGVAV